MANVVVENHLGEVKDAMSRAVEKFLTEAGIHLEGEAKYALEMDPRRIDTGLLRNSITWALDGEGPAIDSYTADKPRTKGGEIESGEYSGTAPSEPNGKRALYIGTNVEYAPYVHEGTKKMAPNRFLKNAIELNKDQLKQKMQETMRNG